MSRRWILYASAMPALVACVATAQTRADRTELLQSALAQESAVIRSLEEMVRIESGSDDHAGVQRMADYVERRLQALGATTERIPATTGSVDLVKGTL